MGNSLDYAAFDLQFTVHMLMYTNARGNNNFTSSLQEWSYARTNEIEKGGDSNIQAPRAPGNRDRNQGTRMYNLCKRIDLHEEKRGFSFTGAMLYMQTLWADGWRHICMQSWGDYRMLSWNMKTKELNY